MECQCWANAQYSRRECLELVGILRSVSDEDLEKKVLKIFEKVGCPIEGNNIEACHRLSEKKKKKKRKHNSEIFLPKGLPKCTWREERVEKVGHMKKKMVFQRTTPIFGVHIIVCYGQRLNVWILWKKSVAFMCHEVPLKSNSVKIVYCCQ